LIEFDVAIVAGRSLLAPVEERGREIGAEAADRDDVGAAREALRRQAGQPGDRLGDRRVGQLADVFGGHRLDDLVPLLLLGNGVFQRAAEAGNDDLFAVATSIVRRRMRSSTSSCPTVSKMAIGQRPRRHCRQPPSARLRSGSKGFYNGGDLKGLTQRLDYIAGLGATAIWLGPIYKNKPVQGPRAGIVRLSRLLDHRLHPGRSAFRHQCRPEGADRRRPCARHEGLSRHHHQSHGRRDQISRVPGQRLPVSQLADYPHSTRGGPAGARINEGFRGIEGRTSAAAISRS
jgi:hypothetical protein